MNNIFHVFAGRCLRENRIWTIVTVIGIVLSMSLLTAVTEAAYSGMEFLRRGEEAVSGVWNACVTEAGQDLTETLSSKKQVKETAEWTEVGWADIEAENEYKSYLLIESMGEGFADMVGLRLADGRMPANENEIILPEHLARNGNIFIPSGTVIELGVGRRTDTEGNILGRGDRYVPGGEKLSDTFGRSYTVVGHYVRFGTDIESSSCPGYTALTVGEAVGQTDVFFNLKNPASYNKFVNEMTNKGVLDADKLLCHYDLLFLYGVMGGADLTKGIAGFAAILVILIFFSSVSLIYNSFSISVSERTKLYGILKSVGATRKQIRSTVNCEAALLTGIGIPIGALTGCAGIGITLFCLRNTFSSLLSTPSDVITSTDVKMKLVLSPWALLISAAICFAAVMASANRPAGRAIRISPIDSVRQREDVSIRAKEVRTSWLTRKLFGLEGMLASKNFKRNRKRYRSVVFSLFVSIVLFITASAFCSYLTAAVNEPDDYGIRSRMDILYDSKGMDMETAEKTMKLLSDIPGVENGFMMSEVYEHAAFDEKDLGEDMRQPEYRDYMNYWYDEPGYVSFDTPVFFVRDEMFRELCEKAGADADYMMDNDAPKALFINRRDFNSAGEAEVLAEDSLPADCRLLTAKDVEGYVFLRAEKEDGKTVYLYYPEEHYEAYRNGAIENLDRDKASALGQEEAVQATNMTIGAFAGEDAASLFDRCGFIYPYSAAGTVFGEEMAEDFTFYKKMFFIVDDHESAYGAMKAALSEAGIDSSRFTDYAEGHDSTRMMVTVINVFSYGFIILISLIALTNVFNTISTNIIQRRREFAMLRSVGMSGKGFDRMMNYECIIYGVKGLSLGIPVSILNTYIIYLAAQDTENGMSFFIPYASFAVAIASVFAVVFATMIFATKKIRKDDLTDALKKDSF